VLQVPEVTEMGGEDCQAGHTAFCLYVKMSENVLRKDERKKGRTDKRINNKKEINIKRRQQLYNNK
jgi:hypothetical protein